MLLKLSRLATAAPIKTKTKESYPRTKSRWYHTKPFPTKVVFDNLASAVAAKLYAEYSEDAL